MPGGNGSATVAASWLLTVADALSTFGFEAHAWLATHGAPPGVLRRTHERVPWLLTVRLWRAAARRIRDPQLGCTPPRVSRPRCATRSSSWR